MCATCLRRAERYALLGAGGQLGSWLHSRQEFYAHVSVLVRGSRTQPSICTRHVQTQRVDCLAGVGTEYPPDATGALKGSAGEATSAPCPSWHHSIVRPCIDHLGSRASWAAFLDQMLVDTWALSWIHVHKNYAPPSAASSCYFSPFAVDPPPRTLHSTHAAPPSGPPSYLTLTSGRGSALYHQRGH